MNKSFFSAISLTALIMATIGCGSDGGSGGANGSPNVNPSNPTRPAGAWSLGNVGFTPSNTVALNTEIKVGNITEVYQITNVGTMPSSITCTISQFGSVIPLGTLHVTPVQALDGASNPIAGKFLVTIPLTSLGIQATAGNYTVTVTVDTDNATDSTNPKSNSGNYTVTGVSG